MIQIIDDWYVTVEPYPTNYVIRRGKGEKDKKWKWLDRARGYFGSLRNAVKEIRRLWYPNTFLMARERLGTPWALSLR